MSGGSKRARHIRVLVAALVLLVIASWGLWSDWHQQQMLRSTPTEIPAGSELASTALTRLSIKGRAPKTGYTREQFGPGWATDGSCDAREHILARDLTDVTYRSETDCTVMSGILQDPYTGKTIHFKRGVDTSSAVQIDHVVALGDAWQKGAQQLAAAERLRLYNDPLELLAVDGPANEQKGDGDAATWLPPNKSYRCRYVARQIAVKTKYHLWVTRAEHDTMSRILDTCPSQVLPRAN